MPVEKEEKFAENKSDWLWPQNSSICTFNENYFKNFVTYASFAYKFPTI